MKGQLLESGRYIGVHASTAELLRKHPNASHMPVVEHEDWHGGYVLHVTEAEYQAIGKFANDTDFTYHAERDSRSCIEAAVIKAFS